MEHGNLGIEGNPVTVFVFEDQIAHCPKPRLEALAVKARRWEAALDFWEFDIQVCDYIAALNYRWYQPVEVLTWHPHGFADLLHDRLWDVGAPVREVRSTSYASASQHLATDPTVTRVYDPDPEHRLGYGFKCREFSLGNV